MVSKWINKQYDRLVLPTLIDWVCGMGPMNKQRQKVVPKAHGQVLEIGIGTGLNMRFYDANKVQSILGLDPAAQMHRLAKKRIHEAGLDVELVPLSAQSIPLEDNSVDTVVVTYTLCTIPEPVPALKEMRRVLKPGGKLLFCEHGLAPDEGVAKWQHKVQPVWGKFSGGCHLNRNIPELLAQAGFITEELEAMYVPGPRLFTYNYWGQAYSESE